MKKRRLRKVRLMSMDTSTPAKGTNLATFGKKLGRKKKRKKVKVKQVNLKNAVARTKLRAENLKETMFPSSIYK